MCSVTTVALITLDLSPPSLFFPEEEKGGELHLSLYFFNASVQNDADLKTKYIYSLSPPSCPFEFFIFLLKIMFPVIQYIFLQSWFFLASLSLQHLLVFKTHTLVPGIVVFALVDI